MTFAPKVNVLVGPNGIGKTNVLEAIHYLSLSKSFLTANDTYVLRKGSPYFEVVGSWAGERRKALKVRVAYVPGEGKRIFVNGVPLSRMAEIVGQVPLVIFAPGDHALTADGPDVRRRFLDNILSQAHPAYLDDLLKYRRALRQRNELLTQHRKRPGFGMEGMLESWTAEVIRLGSRMIHRRLQFVEAFSAFLDRAYQQIESVSEKPTMAYAGLKGLGRPTDLEAVATTYGRALAESARRERAMGRTLVGPHRDELVFKLDGLEVRRFASQGQHRTFGMALKLAQFFYLEDRLQETPVLLLDDVFDSLDPQRAEAFLHLLQSETVGQTIITAARVTPFDGLLAWDTSHHQILRVEDEMEEKPDVA